MSDKIPFTLREPRYDPNTYWGRVFSLAEASSVRYAFVRNVEVMRYYEILKTQEAREEKAMAATGSSKVMLTAVEIEELRHATNIVKAAIHPDTQKPIPMPMRITFFLPGNFPINLGFLFAPPTMFHTIFWQVINQTYNAILNFGNANKSSPISTSDIMTSYVMAVLASCSAGAAVRYLARDVTARASGGRLLVLNGIVSTVACAGGGFANNWFIRQPEIKSGIAIRDPSTDEIMGVSRNCARSAVLQTASSRLLMPLTLGLPGFVIYALEKKHLAPKNTALLMTLQLALICTQLTLAVPLSMAAFPQVRLIDANVLEPEFQNLKSSANGEIIQQFRYNKGL